MSRLPRENPRLPEHINNPPQRPLVELGRLLAVVSIVFVVITAVLVVIAGRLSPLLPFAWERAVVGDPAFFEPWPEATTALRDLVAELEPHAGLADDIEITVHLLDSPLPNAFATLGGHVVVHRGLIERVSSENALAMVLAHEIAHVRYRDPAALLGRTAILQLMLALVSGNSGHGALQNILGSAGLFTTLSFSRDMERRADAAALATLQSYYGHTRGADEFFGYMLEVDDDSAWRDMFRTHPRTVERLHAIADSAAMAEPVPLVPLSGPLERLRNPPGGE